MDSHRFFDLVSVEDERGGSEMDTRFPFSFKNNSLCCIQLSLVHSMVLPEEVSDVILDHVPRPVTPMVLMIASGAVHFLVLMSADELDGFVSDSLVGVVLARLIVLPVAMHFFFIVRIWDRHASRLSVWFDVENSHWCP